MIDNVSTAFGEVNKVPTREELGLSKVDYKVLLEEVEKFEAARSTPGARPYNSGFRGRDPNYAVELPDKSVRFNALIQIQDANERGCRELELSKNDYKELMKKQSEWADDPKGESPVRAALREKGLEIKTAPKISSPIIIGMGI